MVSEFVDTSAAVETDVVMVRMGRKRARSLGILTPRNTVADILDRVGAHYGVTWEELLMKNRSRHLVDARQVAAWLMRQRGMSYPAIGKALGGRDHSTAMHAVACVEADIAENDELRRQLAELGGLTLSDSAQLTAKSKSEGVMSDQPSETGATSGPMSSSTSNERRGA
jgi:hypothetical protein